MSWWFDLAVLAVFVLLLAAMPWKRPHPNHVFALDMLDLISDEDSEPQSESRGVKGSADNQHGDHAP
jgi:hypothetical protein